MIIHIVAGGPKEHVPNLKHFHHEEILWLGVDRGISYIIENGYIPQIALGDFDSLSQKEWQKYKEQIPDIHFFQSEKDETDLELALKLAIKKNPERIRIFGASGGRLDHFLGNIFLLAKYLQSSLPIEFIDRQNLIECKQPGTYQIEKLPDKPYVSFLPLMTLVENLTLQGFKYPLKNRHISFGSTLCISNELICDYGTYSFTKGILLVIRSSDE